MKIVRKFFRSYVFRGLMVIGSLWLGITMILYPEQISHWIIRISGGFYLLSGLLELTEIKLKYLKNKAKRLEEETN